VAPTYCDAGNFVKGDSNLGPVILSGARNTMISDTSDCPGALGLNNKTDLIASLAPGDEYVLKFYATTCGDYWNRLAYAFIDFNSDGIYAQYELLGIRHVDPGMIPVAIEFPFVVPCLDQGALVGRTRMRVFVVEAGVRPDPCASFAYGGAKEFSIDILGSSGLRCGGAPMPTPSMTDYCPAGNAIADGSNLGKVQLLGERTQIEDPTDCPGEVGIRNRTLLYASLKPGGAYTLTFDVTTCEKAYPRLAYAYIDFNHNFVFEPQEFLGSKAVGPSESPVEVQLNFNIPCINKGSAAGFTRMRVFVVENGRDADPCLLFAYGAVKEFSIEMMSQQFPPCGNVTSEVVSAKF